MEVTINEIEVSCKPFEGMDEEMAMWARIHLQCECSRILTLEIGNPKLIKTKKGIKNNFYEIMTCAGVSNLPHMECPSCHKIMKIKEKLDAFWDSVRVTVNISEFDGLVFKKIEISENKEKITFKTGESEYEMYHDRECCEEVLVEDICGDIKDLIDSPILQAEEVIHDKDTNPKGTKAPDGQDEYSYFTWTFYKLSTIKGSVTIRWYVSSSGHYSEKVDIRLK